MALMAYVRLRPDRGRC